MIEIIYGVGYFLLDLALWVLGMVLIVGMIACAGVAIWYLWKLIIKEAKKDV